MPLLSLSNYCLHFGEQIIFDNLEFHLEPGDRLCITGRNGAGKSTLLKSIEGLVTPDSGSRWLDPAIKVASLSQELPPLEPVTVYDFVSKGAGTLVDDIEQYYAISADTENCDLDVLEKLQHRIEANDGWNLNNRIEQVLEHLDLNKDALLSDLSGGWRRRVDLAQALINRPDVLLLDEPTNHLDIGAIKWLEEFLKSYAGAVVFITHDRAFLRAVANRIGELDRGNLLVWKGNYDDFLKLKEHKLAEEEKQNALFDKRLAQEEVWIRQGIKARRTRNEGRVRALKQMREERAARREKTKTAVISHTKDGISGKLVAEFDRVSFGFDNKPIIRDFSSVILRGDKIGLIGPNGVGKSTLLKLILGELAPDQGTIKLGTKLSVAYFDQMRDQLDLEKSAVDNVAGGRDSIEVNGVNKHIYSYLQDFLFSGERARTPIKSLSGGERNRILLAKLFSKPSNLLVMDEPTNDLDAETLELLEDLLMQYSGTLLLVSHDREFLDNVITSTIAFEGPGIVKEYVGGYQDWLAQGGKWYDVNESQDEARVSNIDVPTAKIDSESVETKAAPKKKLSYKLQRELDELPKQLEVLEAEIERLQNQVSAPDFYTLEHEKVNQVLAELGDKETLLQQLFDRWEELDAMT